MRSSFRVLIGHSSGNSTINGISVSGSADENDQLVPVSERRERWINCRAANGLVNILAVTSVKEIIFLVTLLMIL